MSYSIKEIFYSLQGEGFHSGRPSIFCRFTGCNLSCSFCDTDFHGNDGINGGVYENAENLVKTISSIWPSEGIKPFVVCTGGEPLLQLDGALISEMHNSGYEIAIETNGTVNVPQDIDWITVSPKPNTSLVQRSGNEIKVLFPVDGLEPSQYERLEFNYFYIQPVDTEGEYQNIINQKLAIKYCQENPKWRFSCQLHKVLGIQ